MWRRGWDSNPRDALTPAGFQDRFLQPLGHLSSLYDLLVDEIKIFKTFSRVTSSYQLIISKEITYGNVSSNFCIKRKRN